MEQRKIKFRVWNNIGKRMLYDSGLEIKGTKVISKFVMQFTGLKDKNGKEIYEGDIVQRNDGIEPKFEIIWNIKQGAFSLYRLDIQDDEYFRHMKFYDTETELEIIGNIYENKGLLEVQA